MVNISLSQFPKFAFEWVKQGVPSVANLPYGTLALVVHDDDYTGNKPSETVQTIAQATALGFSTDTMKYVTEVFKKSVYQLVIIPIPSLLEDGSTPVPLWSAITESVLDGLLADYVVVPKADATDETALISYVKAAREEAGTIKGIVKEQGTSPDSPYICQYGINDVSFEGTVESEDMTILKCARDRVSTPLTQSLTYKELSETDVLALQSKTEAEASLAEGVNVAMFKNNKFRYARDITSLKTMGDNFDERFREAQRVAAMDTIVRDIKVSWELNWLGNYQNSGDNKRAFIRTINLYLKGRAQDTTDPVQAGIFYIDWEAHRDVLRNAGVSEEEITAIDVSVLEDIDTSTAVYIRGQVQINGVMEDVTFTTDLAKTIILPEELG